MKASYFLLTICAVSTLVSCKKEAGDGGNSSIAGKVTKELRVVLNNPSTAVGTFPAADEDVYIIYGDHISPDDRIKTNYEGEYEFLYLRPGNYKVYVFSNDTNAVVVPWSEEHMTVLKEIEITDNEQQVIVDDMSIYDTN